MQSLDLPQFVKELNALAEVFDKKPVTGRASEVWFDTLKEFPVERVLGLLIAWPKTHNKFPAPAEIWKACSEVVAVDREKKARAEAMQNQSRTVGWHKSPAAEEALEKMRQIVGAKTRIKSDEAPF